MSLKPRDATLEYPLHNQPLCRSRWSLVQPMIDAEREVTLMLFPQPTQMCWICGKAVADDGWKEKTVILNQLSGIAQPLIVQRPSFAQQVP